MIKNDDDGHFMSLALEACQRGIDAGQTPFGACIVRDGQVVTNQHNRVWDTTDITAHAEVVAIREACRSLNTVDLSRCVIYTTTEPCPMCFSAIHWARICRIVYGTSISDAKAYGFNELEIPAKKMKELCDSPIEVVQDCLTEQCREMFRLWQSRSDHRSY